MKKDKKKMGFTLVELLGVVVVLGILTLIGIGVYSNLISSAKKEQDKYNEELIVSATKSYLQANIDKRPKAIGESVEIKLSELKESNYLKEDVKNSDDESCMSESYVYVFKNDVNDYSYEGILHCGKEKRDLDTKSEITAPRIEKVTFANSNDVQKASFSAELYGGSDGDEAKIQSYSYSISVINTTNNSKSEVYNSGNINGRGNKKITLDKVMIKDYINIADYSYMKVTITVINEYGMKDSAEVMSDFEDNNKPICGDITGQAKDDDDWINKDDYFNRNIYRTISVMCSDGDGAGCLRQEFSRKWPDDKKKSVEYATIKIEDNSKKKNSENCKVRVNVDIKAPTIDVILLKNGEENTKLKKKATDGETVTINKNEYPELHNGWLNLEEYPTGAEFKVKVSDDLFLYKYTWQTNGTEAPVEYYFTYDEKNVAEFNINLLDDGENRNGKLTVYDRAGNTTVIDINASIDKTPPTDPKINGYKKTSTDVPASSADLEPYEFGKWYSGFVHTEASDSTDATSGWEGYYCTTQGQAEDINNKKQSTREVHIEGKVSVKYKACDNAGNCSNDTEGLVFLDRSSPTCENVIKCKEGTKDITCTDWQKIGQSKTISTKCTDNKRDRDNSGCNESTLKSHTYDYDINTTNAGAQGNGVEVIIEDNAGNQTKCPITETVRVDHENPTIGDIKVYKWNDNKQDPIPSSSSGLTLFTGAADCNNLFGNDSATCTNENNATWSDKKLFTEISATDNMGNKNITYKYKTRGATTNTEKTGSWRRIEAEGVSCIQYEACDQAGNCVQSTAKTVRIDYTKPTIVATLKNSPEGTFKKEANNSNSNITINSGDFPLASEYSNWLNNSKYSSGAQFDVSVSDDNLSSYTWTTNGTNENGSRTFNNTSAKFDIKLEKEGKGRKGVLTVADKAGNTSKITVNANIDRTAPSKPTVNGYKKKDDGGLDSSSDLNGLDSYTFDTWYNGYVFTKATASTDNLTADSSIKYYCTTTGQPENIENSNQKSRNVNNEGTSTVSYYACDQAKNCSGAVTKRVKIDRKKPTVTVTLKDSPSGSFTKTANDSNSNVTIESKDLPTASSNNGWLNSDNYSSGAKFDVSVSDTSLNNYTWVASGGYENSSATFTKTSDKFEVKLENEGKNRQGVLTVKDKAGNTSKITIKANIDRTPPSAPTVNGYKRKTSDGEEVGDYEFGAYYNGHVITRASGSTDNISAVNYYCTTKGQKEDLKDSKQSSRLVSMDDKDITVSFKACDQAKNCSGYTTKTVRLDRTGPTITIDAREGSWDGEHCNIDSNSPKYTDNTTSSAACIRITTKISDSYSGVKTRTRTITGFADNETNNPIAAESHKNKRGTGTSTLAFYATDNAGNSSNKTFTAKITRCSESNVGGCNYTTTCRKGWTAFYYIDSSGTLWEAGNIQHLTPDSNDPFSNQAKVYLLTDSNGNYIYIGPYEGSYWQKVCVEDNRYLPYSDYYEKTEYVSSKNCRIGYIAAHCTGAYYGQLGEPCTNDEPEICKDP